MTPRTLLLLAVAALLGAAVVVLPALAAAPSQATLEVNENCEVESWPCWAAAGSGAKAKFVSKITIATGGEVKFADKASTEANIAWTGYPPVCSGVPISPASPKTNWEGTCKFEQAGTYKFESSTLFNGGPGENYTKYEIVVEGATTGTTPTGTGTTTETTPSTPTGSNTGSGSQGGGSSTPLGGASPVGSLFVGSASSACKLSSTQHGQSVHGSIDVSQAGAGGRLQVELLAANASLAGTGHSSRVPVGRLVRSSLPAGLDRFTVALDAKARRALHAHGHLALSVRVLLTSIHGSSATIARNVVLHP